MYLLTGLAIVHPSFDRPSSLSSQMLFTSVAHFENYDGFADILQLMLRLVLANVLQDLLGALIHGVFSAWKYWQSAGI